MYRRADLLHDRQYVMQFPPEVLRSIERTTETYLVNYLGFTKIPQDAGQLFLGVSAVQPDATCIELVAEAHWVPARRTTGQRRREVFPSDRPDGQVR